MTRWIRQGTPGHVIVTGEVGRYLKVDVYDGSGTKTHTDRLNPDPETGGPRGYVDPAAPPTVKPKRITHHWGLPMRDVDGYVSRCACGTERQEVGNGGRWLYRVKGGTWAPGPVPKCEARP